MTRVPSESRSHAPVPSRVFGLLGLVFASSVLSCDAPFNPDIQVNAATLSGGRIEARVGDWFNLDELLGKDVFNAAVSSPLLSIDERNGDAFILCNEAGDGYVGPAFTDETSASYPITCVGQVTLGLHTPLNLDQYFGRNVVWVVQSSGLISQTQVNGDITIECVQEGTGTLWVAFTSPDTRYYDLTCRTHEQGNGG
jgi:hypothetical protein